MLKIKRNESPRWPSVAILDLGYFDITFERFEPETSNLARSVETIFKDDRTNAATNQQIESMT